MEKLKVFKGCSCYACTRGLRTKGGHWFQRYQQKRFRHRAKQELKIKGEVETGPVSDGYTD